MLSAGEVNWGVALPAPPHPPQGVSGILDDMVGVADLDRGVLGILNDNPGNAFAFWSRMGLQIWIRVCWGS